MASPITKETLLHLAKLARIELTSAEEEKFLIDLSKILGHVSELQQIDTSEVAPLTGGTELKNVFREDAASDSEETGTNRGAGIDAFPESENGFLKIPPVFD